MSDETLEQKVIRYELTLRAIAICTLTGVDYGDWVQCTVEDALDGLFPECWNCGTFVHDGPCVSEEAAREMAAERDGDEARDLGYDTRFAMYRGEQQHQQELARRLK